MKRIILGLALLLSIQVVGVFANDKHVAEVGKEPVNAQNSVGCDKDKDKDKDKDDGILPRVGRILTSTKGAAMIADGTIFNEVFTFVVLDKSQGLARIKISSPRLENRSQLFLLGRVGNEYEGTGVDGEGSISLKKINNHLEVTFTRVRDSIGDSLQIRAKFPL